MWELAEHRDVHIELLPAHAGHSMTAIFTHDLDTMIEGITLRGLEPAKR
ncbi:hypothetical protein [Herbidospora sp. RD11066]